jgi:hypothetical protein
LALFHEDQLIWLDISTLPPKRLGEGTRQSASVSLDRTGTRTGYLRQRHAAVLSSDPDEHEQERRINRSIMLAEFQHALELASEAGPPAGDHGLTAQIAARLCLGVEGNSRAEKFCALGLRCQSVASLPFMENGESCSGQSRRRQHRRCQNGSGAFLSRVGLPVDHPAPAAA